MQGEKPKVTTNNFLGESWYLSFSCQQGANIDSSCNYKLNQVSEILLNSFPGSLRNICPILEQVICVVVFHSYTAV